MDLKEPKKPDRVRRLRPSMRLDRVNPFDLRVRRQIFACEQCSHYSETKGICTMGFEPQFRREVQMKRYDLSGFMAFCRFQEID